MRRLMAEIEEIRQRNRESARLTCLLLDVVQRTGLRPADLQGAQTGVRKDLLFIESRLSEVRARSKGVRKRLWARAKRGSVSRDAVRQHIEAMQVRERVLVLGRLVLRQIADAFAWVALRQEARLIFPLYRKQTHTLPRREGLGGPAEIARQAMESGKFFVIENDLTRCLGLGDLTVVFADRPWRRPLTFEVKSSAHPAWEVGGELRLQIFGVHSDDPIDKDLSDEFERTIGGGPIPESEPLKERAEQTAELLAGTRLLVAASSAVGQRLPGPSPRAWKAIDTVLSRALADGTSYDIAEPGVAFLAMRCVDDRAPSEISTELFETVGSFPGFGDGGQSASSVNLRENDEWSATVLPIALWPISPQARAALLSGELYLACVIRPDVWQEAMRAEGLELTVGGDGWRVKGPDTTTTRIDPIEVGKLTLGVAFSGVSPREIAAGLSASLKRGAK